jgi:hypothetical protein
MRRCVRFISFLKQKCQAIVHESEIEEEAVASETISTVADDLDTTLWVVTIQSSQNLMMRKTVALLHYNVFGCPFSLDDIVILKREKHISKMAHHSALLPADNNKKE